MSENGPRDEPDTVVHPEQPAEGDREEVDRALAGEGAESPPGESVDDAGDGDE